jgi:hypothetical protein
VLFLLSTLKIMLLSHRPSHSTLAFRLELANHELNDAGAVYIPIALARHLVNSLRRSARHIVSSL